ncbi:hypothetical protein [Catenulispora subtropica]|uniref:DUF1998 domain-containing protein n=1 Tax=Catenulispora subtropica TaxID=450798 RepID=A0ABN2TEN8_9ACTN
MKDERSVSQVLYGFLPQQTGDLKGGVYRTVDWRDPRSIDVDEDLVRGKLLEELRGWEAAGANPAIAREIERKTVDLDVVEVNRQRGVQVERFPQVWICAACRRVGNDRTKPCACGAKQAWRQLHFVGYHECGQLEEPYIKRCKEHFQARMLPQQSMDATKIIFDCPICAKKVQTGLGWRKCPCGKTYSQRPNAEFIVYQVHRAASVYAPQSFTIVNPADRDGRRTYTEPSGRRSALTWALSGFHDDSPASRRPTGSGFVESLIAQGFTRELAEQLARAAAAGGGLASEDDLGSLADAPSSVIEAVERESVEVALGLMESRTRIHHLVTDHTPTTARDRYEIGYPRAVSRAGLSAVDLTDRFPVLKAVYGFTRGGDEPGTTRLSLYWTGTRGRRIYANLQQAEALFFQLDPLSVHQWLTDRGHPLQPVADRKAARCEIAANALVPSRFDDEGASQKLGRDLLTLTHSYAHRAIRQLSVLAGVDREGLGEYLLPLSCGFFVYAATRGDFVLGGLQAVFEHDLDLALAAIVSAESRCAMDPACERNGGACPACLHIGEPACTYFNHFLDRKTLFGQTGYLAVKSRTPTGHIRDVRPGE